MINPGTRKVIADEGMPIAGSEDSAKLAFGSLIVRFDIAFPDYLPEENKEILERIFRQVDA